MATKYEELIEKIANLEKQLSTCIGDECKAIESKIIDLKSNIPVIDRDELISDIADELEKRGTFAKGMPPEITEDEIVCPSCGEVLKGDEKACPSCKVELEWVD
jgi:rubrerythrin